jgi:glutathione S-transferase
MYRLYGNPGTGSASVEAALALVGADHEIVTVNTRSADHMSAAYAAINPRQQVPAMMLPDGTVITEGVAMMLHLADAFPEAKLGPAPGSSLRAAHDRWLIFMVVNIYGYPDRYIDDPNGSELVFKSAEAYVARHYAILDAAIAGPYLLGETMTMADIYLWMVSSWVDQAWLAENYPKVKALADLVVSNPKIATVAAAHAG